MFIFMILPLDVRAGAETGILQAYVSGDLLTLFTSGRLRYDSLICTISTQSCELNSSGKLSDGGARIKTTVLIDVSNSVPDLHSGIDALLRILIENKPANEEFKLVAFGETAEILSDFSADRYDLAAALEKIKPQNGESKIYDAIYNTIPSPALFENQPTFCRTILICGDFGDIGNEITKEELFMKLHGERYPVDVVETKAGETAKSNDLAAIARVSGGRHYSPVPKNELQFLAETLGAGDYFYYTAKIPSGLLDGSVRQIDIGDGTNKMSLDLKFPVFAAPPKKISQMEIPENIEAAAKSDGSAAYFAAGGALFAIASMMIASGAIRKKKANNFINSESGPVSGGGGETEFFGESGFRDGRYAIKLGSANDPGKSWTFSVEGELLIGRAPNCRLRLEDRSVSREQCKIMPEGKKFVLVHLGATNKTAVNGKIADKSMPLQIGDTIKFGRESLKVDYLSVPGKPDLPLSDSIQNAGKGKTALLF